MPREPQYEQPVFTDDGTGLQVAYDEYRKLERNIIAMRAYIQKLRSFMRMLIAESTTWILMENNTADSEIVK